VRPFCFAELRGKGCSENAGPPDNGTALIDGVRPPALAFRHSVTQRHAVPKKSALPDFEAALTELEKIVEKMESGEQSLEEALAAFQRGIELTRTCQQGLKEAEQRVDKLLVQNGEARIVPATDEQD
jgi:exodeoxyribonuclease VII small subunit